MMTLLPRDDRLVLPGILVGGALQLALCVSGQVDIGLVVCVYAAEAVLLVPLLRNRNDAWHTFRLRMGGVVLCALAVWIAAQFVDWTPWTIATAAGLWLLALGGWLWEARERQVSPWKVVTTGAARLHVGILVVGLAGLGWARQHGFLLEYGWPGPDGTTQGDVGTRLVSLIIESGVAPLTVPAVLLVVFRTMNEVFLELYRMLGSTPSSDPDAPSSSFTTA